METTETVDLSTPDVPIRTLATGGDADERYPVPSKQRFKDAGEGVIEADDLARIANALIADDALPLGHLAALRIGYLWAERGGSTGGFPCFGRLIKASKALLHYAEIDYLVMLSADHLRDAKATRWQVEALVGHQLGHVEMLTTEKGEDRYSVKGHDFEGFAFEFRRWGAYLPGMVAPAQSAASAVQMGLVFEEGEDDGDEDYDPTIAPAQGVEDEPGPDPDGAPDAEWAEFDGLTPDDYLGPMTAEQEDATSQAIGRLKERHDAVRANFPTAMDGVVEVCRLCGVDVFDHDPEVCEGGTPAQRQGRRKAKAATPESDVTNGVPLVLGDPRGSNGNGTHGRDDVAGVLLDPDRVMATLTERGWKIAFHARTDTDGGNYLNPETGALYDTGDVETSYRRAIGGRAIR